MTEPPLASGSDLRDGLVVRDITDACAGTAREPRGGAIDAFALAAPLRSAPGFFLLDGGLATSAGERWSFFGARPVETLVARVNDANDPWERLRAALAARRARLASLAAHTTRAARSAIRDDLPPFPSGGVAVLGYDLGRRLERWPARATRDVDLPEMHVAFHDALVAVDHARGRVFACGLADAERAVDALAGAVVAGVADGCAAGVPDGDDDDAARAERDAAAPERTFERERYVDAVGAVRDLIAAGHVYQVNLSQRFTVSAAGAAPRALYARLRRLSPAPFGAFIDLGAGRAILSSSPERFLRVQGAARGGPRRVESWPIKGTRPRGEDRRADALLRAELAASAKDRAELAMIVDLVRNDLGRIARAGTVRVEDCWRIESFATVHHLVATVAAEARDDVDAVAIIAAAFPAGSITGCPKLRAIEVIDEIEPVRRGVYTGAIGWLSDTGDLDTNVAIRTIVCEGGRVRFHVGGGVTWKSDPDAEHRETLDKGRAFFRLLGIDDAALDAAAPALAAASAAPGDRAQ